MNLPVSAKIMMTTLGQLQWLNERSESLRRRLGSGYWVRPTRLIAVR